MARPFSRDLHTLFDRFESVIRAHPQAAAQLAFAFGVWAGKGVGAPRPGKRVAKNIANSVTKKAATLPRKFADAALQVIGALPTLQPSNEHQTHAGRRPTRAARKTTISTTTRNTENG